MKNKKDNVKSLNSRVSISIWILAIISFVIIAAILVIQFLFDNGAISSNQFYSNTRINGIDVTGMNKNEVANIISNKLISEKDNVSIKLLYEGKEWILLGSDFEYNNEIFPIVEQAFEKGREGTIAERISTVRDIKSKGFATDISYRYILGGFDERIDSIIVEINKDPVEPSITFDPNSEKMFILNEGIKGVSVDKEILYKMIDQAFCLSQDIVVDIPTSEVLFEKSGEELLENTKLRSSFSTSYVSSQAGRKNNVKIALSEFNGFVVEPGQEVSFNEITGDKTPEKGYQKAKIILNGIYVEGYGGGACQASTTLYNALLLSDLEIIEVHPHSLPVSYVPLAFDAMVSEGYADLKFKNNLDYPIYIKTWGDQERAYVNIYGAPIEKGKEIQRKAEFIEVIPHQGDMIIKDTKGEYADKITYIGEYLRIKNPQEGYHSKAYICYYENGELTSQKLIRDEIYKPQKGIIMEGTETLGEGMTIPENEVKIIPPQNSTNINENTVDKKISEQSPSNYNP